MRSTISSLTGKGLQSISCKDFPSPRETLLCVDPCAKTISLRGSATKPRFSNHLWSFSTPVRRVALNFFPSISPALSQDVHVYSAGYECRMRPWFCGVADPGTGKSHAADPHIGMVEEACKTNSTYAPGSADDSFHVDYSRTYASFEHKISTTSGYG